MLLNRIVDSDVFGSSCRDMPFHIDGEEGVSEEVRDWFQSRRISYFHDQEKGMVFLQMCSTKCPAMRGAAVAGKEEKVNSGLDSVIDELEVRELQGLLFMFSVTPPFPIVLATNPVVQFEGSCQPSVVSTHEDRLQFSLECQVILPPESFVSLRLPFVYGVEVKDKGLLPLNPFEIQPELTAWIKHGTVLQMICQGSYLE